VDRGPRTFLYKGPVPTLHEGDEFAGHRILGVAGRGGMGVVYRALQLDLERPVALKLIAPQLAEDPGFRERFARESRVAASIDHPNVIPIYYTGEHDGTLYIAMRYVEGSDLRTLVRAEGRLDPGRAAHIVGQVASALDAAHARGIVHRDVKPANVLLGAGDHAYLTDFGLTKSLTSHTVSTRDGGWVGTLGYVAPEQIRGGRIDARADVYALGCVLYHALSGTPPYQRDTDEATLWAHLHDDPPSIAAHAAGVPARFDEVLRRAMAKDPDERYPSAGDLGRAALAAAGRGAAPGPERRVAVGEAAPGDEQETVVSPDQAATAVAGRRPVGGRLWPWALAALPIAALAVIAALALGGDGDGDGQTTGRGTTTATTPQGDASVPTRSLRLEGRPNNIVVASGSAWVVRSGVDRLAVIDAETMKQTRFRPQVGDPAGEAAGFGKLWVGNQAGPTLVPIGLKSHRQEGRVVALPPGGRPVAVAAGERAVWVGIRGRPGLLLRVDPRRREVVKTIPLPDGLQNIAVGGGAVWVIARRGNTVTRVDIGDASQRSVFVGEQPFGIAYGLGAVWVTNNGDDTVTRIDGGSLNTGVIGVGRGPKGIAVGAGGVWVANSIASTLTRIDPATNQPAGEPIKVALNPYAVDVAGDDVWVTSPAAGQVQRLTPR
jgi:DNA-binding beta-propeller fold protein YncE/predicted Ser/Thr protein kinase